MLEGFAPYLPPLLEKLLHDAAADIDIKLEDAEIAQLNTDEPEGSGVTSIKLNMKGMEGDKKLSLNTNALENKINAVETLRDLIHNLEYVFFPYIEQTWAVISTLLNYKYSKAVRNAAWESAHFMIETCPGQDTMVQIYQQLFPYFKERLTEQMEKKNHEDLTNLLNTLLHTTEGLENPGFLPFNEVEWLFGFLAQCAWYNELEKDMKKMKFEEGQATQDEEDAKDFDQIIDELQKLGSNIMEIAGKFMKLYKAELTPVVRGTLIKPFAKLLDKSNCIEAETIDACCFFIDVLENLDDNIFLEYYLPLTKKFCEIWDQYRDNPDRSVLQSTGFGFGVIAQRAPHSTFGTYGPEITRRLIELLVDPTSPEDDNVYSFENCISSLGKLVYFHYDEFTITKNTVEMFLRYLPLQVDSTEARPVNKLFFQ